MIGALLGAATGVASSLIGGLKSNKQARKYDAELKNREKSDKDWFNARYNQDYTQRADAQNLLRQAREQANDAIRTARGTSAVMGSTPESVAAATQAANTAYGNTVADVASQASAYKDAIDNANQQNMHDISNAKLDLYNERMKNATEAANQGMKAGMGIVALDAKSQLDTGKGIFESMFSGKRDMPLGPGVDTPTDNIGFSRLIKVG